MDSFQSDYSLEETPIITLDDWRVIGMATGVVVVALALVIAGAMWVMGKLRTW